VLKDLNETGGHDVSPWGRRKKNLSKGKVEVWEGRVPGGDSVK